MFGWFKRKLIEKALKEVGKSQEVDNIRLKLLKSIRDELNIIAEIYEDYLNPMPQNEEKKNWLENLIQQVITQKFGSEIGLKPQNISNIAKTDNFEEEIQKFLASIKKK